MYKIFKNSIPPKSTRQFHGGKNACDIGPARIGDNVVVNAGNGTKFHIHIENRDQQKVQGVILHIDPYSANGDGGWSIHDKIEIHRSKTCAVDGFFETVFRPEYLHMKKSSIKPTIKSTLIAFVALVLVSCSIGPSLKQLQQASSVDRARMVCVYNNKWRQAYNSRDNALKQKITGKPMPTEGIQPRGNAAMCKNPIRWKNGDALAVISAGFAGMKLSPNMIPCGSATTFMCQSTSKQRSAWLTAGRKNNLFFPRKCKKHGTSVLPGLHVQVPRLCING